jgi:hypothetical protein
VLVAAFDLVDASKRLVVANDQTCGVADLVDLAGPVGRLFGRFALASRGFVERFIGIRNLRRLGRELAIGAHLTVRCMPSCCALESLPGFTIAGSASSSATSVVGEVGSGPPARSMRWISGDFDEDLCLLIRRSRARHVPFSSLCAANRARSRAIGSVACRMRTVGV